MFYFFYKIIILRLTKRKAVLERRNHFPIPLFQSGFFVALLAKKQGLEKLYVGGSLFTCFTQCIFTLVNLHETLWK